MQFCRRVPRAEKQRLLREGRWQTFLQKRIDIAKERGYEHPVEATREALALFPPREAPQVVVEEDGKPKIVEAKKAPRSAPLAKPAIEGLRPEQFADKPRSTRRQDLKWALDNSAYIPGSVTPADAPSAHAWRLMEMLRDNSDFFMQIETKLQTGKAEDGGDDSDGLSDTDLTEHIDRVRALAVSALSDGAEGPPSEPAVSQEHHR